MTQIAEGWHFDFRMVNARSWWLATELCRRHAQLAIVELHPTDGASDTLGIYDELVDSVIIEINRAGTITTRAGDDSDEFGWIEVFGSEPFETVLRLERDAGLAPVSKPLKTTGPLLAYRIISAVVGASQNEKDPWDVRSAYLETYNGDGGVSRHLFEEFRGAQAQREKIGETPLGDPAHGFWGFRRSYEVEFMIDQWGHLYRREEDPVDLNQRFAEAGHNVWALVSAVLGDELP